MRIVAIEPLGISDKKLAKSCGSLIEKGHTVMQYQDKVEDMMELIKRARDADVLVVMDQILPGKLLEACPNIKMISIASVFHRQVDLQKAKAKLVPVCAISNHWTYSIAELSIGLLLAVIRRIVAGDSFVRGNDVVDNMEGRELFGKTVGIIGTGPEGLHVARILKAFGCELLGYDEIKNKEAEVWAGIEYVKLEELLTRSDVVTLHLSLTPWSEGLLNKDRIAIMKQGAILINTAHAEMVDYKALSVALKKKRLSGAGIDVFDVELPLTESHPLFKAPNTVLTPVFGAATSESLDKRIEIAISNITGWMEGKPKHVIV